MYHIRGLDLYMETSFGLVKLGKLPFGNPLNGCFHDEKEIEIGGRSFHIEYFHNGLPADVTKVIDTVRGI